MIDATALSEKLRKVLEDLEKITDEVEMQAARDSTSNDDFLTRGKTKDE